MLSLYAIRTTLPPLILLFHALFSGVSSNEDQLEQAYLQLYNNNNRHHVDFSALSRLLNNPNHRDEVEKAGLGSFASFLGGKSPQSLERMTTAWHTGNAGRMLKVLGEKELPKLTAHMREFNEWVAEMRRSWMVDKGTGEVVIRRAQ